MSQQIGIINEIGDLSLGFDPLNEKDQSTYNKILEQQQADGKRVANATTRPTDNTNTR